MNIWYIIIFTLSLIGIATILTLVFKSLITFCIKREIEKKLKVNEQISLYFTEIVNYLGQKSDEKHLTEDEKKFIKSLSNIIYYGNKSAYLNRENDINSMIRK